MDALVFQLGISGPLVLAVLVYAATRREQGLLQRYLLALLALILTWMVGLAAQAAPSASVQHVGNLLVRPPAAFMAPAFCLVMLLYARVELFERSRGARWALLLPFWFFLAAFLTDDWHGLMALEDPEPGDAPRPLFWSFQVCTNAAAVIGLAIGARIARSSPSAEERRRMALLFAGAFLPLVAHLAFTFRLLPLAYPLTPGSLGITSLLLVTAIHRYRLLDVQPVARRDVIEASRDAVIIADADEVVVDLNPMAAAMLGGARAALGDSGLSAVLARLGPTKPVGVLEHVLAALRHDATPPVCELVDADGRTLEVSAGRVRGTAGATAGYFVVLRDRTTERRAERMMHHSQRLESVGILAAGVAHEVNNPLAFVRANLAHIGQVARVLEDRAEELPKDLLEETREIPDVVHETLGGLQRIEEIVRGLLGLSRTPSDRIEPCDVNEIAREAAHFASLDGDDAVRIEWRLAPDLPSVRASSDHLVQVLLNLFLNSRRALRDRHDASIAVSTGAGGGCVEIRVTDNGPGIPEAIRDKVFDPFFTTRAPNEGTGLGLPIAFDIVREHGGTLELETPASGGACFVVRLPEGDRRAAEPDGA